MAKWTKKEREQKPVVTDAERLAGAERSLRKLKGKNRERAFDELFADDVDRAVRLAEELVEGASGANRAELAALLARTGIPRVVERAARGKYGPVVVADHAPLQCMDAVLESFAADLPRLQPAEIEKRARHIGLVPRSRRLSMKPVSRAATLVRELFDDGRLSDVFRKDALAALGEIDPAAVWARREQVPIVEALVAGFASGVAQPGDDELSAWMEALRALPAPAREAALVATRLPATGKHLPRAQKLLVFGALLEHVMGAIPVREAAAMALAAMGDVDANDIVLAHPRAHAPSTVHVCENLHRDEAVLVLGPLVREDPAIALALAKSPMATDPRFLDDAVALMPRDPLAAEALLRRSRHPRAAEELQGLKERLEEKKTGR